MISLRLSAALSVMSAVALILSACSTESENVKASPSQAARRSESQQSFVQMATVLRHPRCINCHPATDYPRQGMEGRRHAQLVMRGPNNHGAPALQCATCHQTSNQDDRVPGAPHWGLAPITMAWDGLDDHDLAEALKDRLKNGNRSLEALHDHMANDALVAWAWNPGGSREKPPISHDDFARLVKLWIETGAVSPDKPRSVSN